MDVIDKKILDLLQRDCTLSIAEIGEQVGLSQTPCWKRIQRLEADGIHPTPRGAARPRETRLGPQCLRVDRDHRPFARMARALCGRRQ